MMQKLFQGMKQACIATLALTLAGCGGDGSLLKGRAGAFNADSANIFKGILGSNVPGMPSGNTGTMDFGNLQGLPTGGISTQSIGARALSCETVVVDATDADNDDIAVSKKSTYNCTNNNVAGDLWDIKGTVVSMDKDDSVPGLKGGFKIDIDLESTWRDPDGTNLKYTTEGLFEATASGSTSNFTSKFKQAFKGVQFAYGKLFEINYRYETNFKVSYTGDATSGTVKMEGLIGIDGQFPGNGGLETAKATVEIRSKNLTYSNACTSFFDQGSVEYVDGSNNVITVVYNCNAGTWYYNGTAL